MAFLDEEFTLDTLPKGNTSNFEPLPDGWYNATITGAEIKATKAGDGKFISAKYTITGPTHQGRVVFGNLNIKNASAKAEEIGRQQLGEIMRAIGLAKVTDTDQLIGGSLQIKLEVRAATEQYAAQNEVKGFKSITGSAPAFSAPASTNAAPAATKSAPPWAGKGK